MLRSLCHVALVWQFIIGTTISAPDSIKFHPGDEVIFRTKDEQGVEMTIPMRKVDSFLANENVPVWLVRKKEPDVLISRNQLMKSIGSFTTYQNSNLSSAAVYFHEFKKFYGTIDARYFIDGVFFEDTKEIIEISRYISVGISERHPDLHGHGRSRSTDRKMLNDGLESRSESAVRLRQNPQQIHYIQILVIISSDLLMGIERDFKSTINVIHNVLILFNSVDMLFSKLVEFNIRVNIAGIIVVTHSRALSLYAACYKSQYADANCINVATRFYLQRFSSEIPPDSYNMAIFLTSEEIGMRNLFTRYKLGGLTSLPTYGMYYTRDMGKTEKPVIAATHQEYFGSFAIVAHEMTHGLEVLSHDKPSYHTKDNDQCRYIMQPEGYYCENCLSWSPATIKILQRIFSARDHCFYVNKPRSLEKPGPWEIQTADEQCQCFGYESEGSPKQSLMKRICGIPTKERCVAPLTCYDSKYKSYKLPFPLDGTLCGEDTDGVKKVCWNKKCVPIQEHERPVV